MPEVAEVALTAQYLNSILSGKRLQSLEFTSGRYTKKDPEGLDDFLEDLPLRVVSVNSKGKFLWFHLENKNSTWYIWNTFGLTGEWSRYDTEYTRAIFEFSERIDAYYSDMRNFGTFTFNSSEEKLEKKLNTLGPDSLKTKDLDMSGVKKYDIPIVKILMDQKKVCSGLGNYLTAEILYRAKISPYSLGSSLTKKEISRLTECTKYMTKLAYYANHTGYIEDLEGVIADTPRKNYHPDVKLGRKKFEYQVYKQKKDPYGNPVKVAKIVGSGSNMRSTYWVPAVQK